jgi:hypothetical protein
MIKTKAPRVLLLLYGMAHVIFSWVSTCGKFNHEVAVFFVNLTTLSATSAQIMNMSIHGLISTWLRGLALMISAGLASVDDKVISNVYMHVYLEFFFEKFFHAFYNQLSFQFQF